MNSKIFLLHILFFLNLQDFVNSSPNYSPNTAFIIYNSFKQPPNNSANNSDLMLLDVNKIELKIVSLINEKMQEINKGLIDNSNYTEKFILNAFNNIELKMESIIIEKMAKVDKELTKLASVNNTEKIELRMELLNDKMEKIEKELTKLASVNNTEKIELRMELMAEKMAKIDKELTKLASANNTGKIEHRMELITEKMAKIDEELTKLDSANHIEKMERKIESLINDKIDKTNKELTKIINENMSKLEDKMINGGKCSNISKPRSCYELKGCDSNIYNLMLPEVSSKAFPAACDLKTLGGGWTIIQRRQDGSENFYRYWTDYAEGFGDVNGEFFLGLNKIHALTASFEPHELYIMLEDFEGVKKYARYGEFKIDSESKGFILTVGQYSGNAGDSLTHHNNTKFSTRDRDNDIYPDYHCAEGWKGAWWYRKCFHSNLNGQYFTGEKIKTDGGASWYTFSNSHYSLKFIQMMIRPKEN